VNGTVHATSSSKTGIGGIYNGIRFLFGYISLHKNELFLVDGDFQSTSLPKQKTNANPKDPVSFILGL